MQIFFLSNEVIINCVEFVTTCGSNYHHQYLRPAIDNHNMTITPLLCIRNHYPTTMATATVTVTATNVVIIAAIQPTPSLLPPPPPPPPPPPLQTLFKGHNFARMCTIAQGLFL